MSKSVTVFAQGDNLNFGIKGGLNFSKYSPNKNTINYDLKIGFYAGGFLKFKFNENWQLQPELLFALQGSKVNVDDIQITDTAGNPLPNSAAFNFEYQIHELTVSLPIIFKLYFNSDFYSEAGPQFGLIVDRTIKSSQSLLSGNDASFIKTKGDTFDFGICLGIGYDISDTISVNARGYYGSIKRDDDIKSSVANFGIEYNFR